MKNERGVTLVTLMVTVIVIFILAGISLNMIISDNSVLTIAFKSKRLTLAAEVEELLAPEFLIEENLDHLIYDFESKGYVKRILNRSEQEIFWVTKLGIEKLAHGYEDETEDDILMQKIASGEIEQDASGNIVVNSIDDLLNTKIFVIDRNQKVAYLDDKVYGKVDFIKSNVKLTEKWWKEK